MDGIIFYCYFVVIIKQIKKFSLWFFCCRVVTRPERRELRGPRTRNPFSTLGQFIPHPLPLTRHVPGWSTLGDQTGPVDIRGARPLHSGCCEAVLECASHAVDSRIFGSSTFFKNKTIKKKKRDIFLRVRKIVSTKASAFRLECLQSSVGRAVGC